jgi:hypothetical protein
VSEAYQLYAPTLGISSVSMMANMPLVRGTYAIEGPMTCMGVLNGI